ncbi:MAG TPA: SDR family NAD(P)-dependent oxidoreductase, partial [Saprospiraceae bacterium]|nr:SDR family NAD(P)-dependent oxidoreductase [Saprospiraceae bacterium]
GLATAREFAAHGYNLVLTARRADRLEQIREELSAFPIDIVTLCFDVRDYQACEAAISSINSPIDILINNAGLARGLDYIHEGNIEHWEEMIDTNVKGLLYITRLITPGMVKRKSGHIINIDSTAGKEVYPRGNVYAASKFAVDALTKGMRMDLYTHGIRVSQVSPGHVEETEFARVRFDWDLERAAIYKDFNPLTSKDVAEVIYFMATRPPHVNIQDIVLMGTQQASNLLIDRSGRKYDPA